MCVRASFALASLPFSLAASPPLRRRAVDLPLAHTVSHVTAVDTLPSFLVGRRRRAAAPRRATLPTPSSIAVHWSPCCNGRTPTTDGQATRSLERRGPKERNSFIGRRRQQRWRRESFLNACGGGGGGKRLSQGVRLGKREREREGGGEGSTNERQFLPFFALFASPQIGRRKDGQSRYHTLPYGPM